MIIRRLILGVVLLLLASTTTLVVVGLDDTARSVLLDRLPPPPNTTSLSSVPPTEPSTQPTTQFTSPTVPHAQPSATATARPGPPARPSPGRPSQGSPAQGKPSTPPSVQGKPSAPPRRSKVVYLTFDDGPSPYTPRVLQILRRTGSTATFFQLGVNTPGHDQLTAAIRAQGSTIGNHSYDHPDLTRLTGAQLRRQIDRGPASRCFRPPYGATNTTVRAAIRRAGARQVLWTVDTRDWTQPGVTRLQRVGRSPQIRPGSIILMHDGGGDRDQTVAALPALISHLHARGFQVRALRGCQ